MASSRRRRRRSTVPASVTASASAASRTPTSHPSTASRSTRSRRPRSAGAARSARSLLIAESTAVASQAQADATARSLLNLRLALSRTFQIESVPNPALEAEDVVALVFPDGSVEQQAIKETHISLGPDGALGLVTVDKYAGDFAPEALTVLHGDDAAVELIGALVAD